MILDNPQIGLVHFFITSTANENENFQLIVPDRFLCSWTSSRGDENAEMISVPY